MAPEALLSPGPGLFLPVCGFQLAVQALREQCDGELQLPGCPYWMSCVQCACICNAYMHVCLCVGGVYWRYVWDMYAMWYMERYM